MSASRVKIVSHKGFTLIELTIGISVLALALLVMTGSLFPQAARSTDPWFQVRSAELAQSLMNQILARRFDENSLVLGDLRCGEDTGLITALDCATQVQLDNCATTEELDVSNQAIYADFDDVDDFNCLNLTGNQITNVSGIGLANVYEQFNVRVNVRYDGALKLITVTVSPPRGSSVIYNAYKANY